MCLLLSLPLVSAPISSCDGHQSHLTREPGALMVPKRLCKALLPMATGCPGSWLRGISCGHSSTHYRYSFPQSRRQGKVPLLLQEPSSAEIRRRPRTPAAGRGPQGPSGRWNQVSPSVPTWAPTHLLPLFPPRPIPEETPPRDSTVPSPPCGLADTPCRAVVQSLGNSTYGLLHGLQRTFLPSPFQSRGHQPSPGSTWGLAPGLLPPQRPRGPREK